MIILFLIYLTIFTTNYNKVAIMAKIIDGKNIALTIRLIIKRSVLELGKKNNFEDQGQSCK